MASLFIANIKIAYTEELIIYNFWKYGLGKVSRVDFEPVNAEYRSAFIYTEHSWDTAFTQALEKDSVYHLNLTHNIDPPTTWTITKNPNPLPNANTSMNIHQLYNENLQLKTNFISRRV